jgi:NitT/TauT family transport system permease protein
LVVVNALPKVALLPIFFIFFGDLASIFVIAFTISIFITIIMIYSGFQEIHPNKIKLARSFNATRLQILAKVILPGSVPTMIAALKINVGLALVGVVVGEFQAGQSGLGALIIYGSQLFAMDLVMAAIIILAAISNVMYVCVYYFEAIAVRHRA